MNVSIEAAIIASYVACFVSGVVLGIAVQMLRERNGRR